ncbi:hypothetical protein [Vibrio maerlii]|uniref:hypothetical protein n=1 Tax=Vibrio maerlii TaxID=2231648 RepID=UPI000E3C01A1|nr:hypothetical protein [Vibrio maerlii]
MNVSSKLGSVYSARLGDKKVWVKRCGEDKRTRLNQTIQWVSNKFVFLKHWQLSSALCPVTRFKHELKHHQYFQSLGLPVPKILYHTEHYFITEDKGVRIDKCNQAPNSTQLALAFDALTQFHQAGVVHGRPNMRDIVYHPSSGIHLLDLEEAKVSKCPKLVARDVFLFLLDSYRLFGVSQSTRMRLLLRWLHATGKHSAKYLNFILGLLRLGLWIPLAVLKFRDNRLSSQILLTFRLLKKTKAHYLKKQKHA